MLSAIRSSVATAMLIAAAALAAPAIASDAVPGKPAPDFRVKDQAGVEHTLAQYKGKTVVLEWTNHLCPYVGKHYGAGNMQALQKEAATSGVVWLSVVSSAPGEQGYVDGPMAERLTRERKAEPAAVLLDETGEVGQAYGAAATPSMYVIDKAGTLVYAGAIDDKPSASRSSLNGARNYVREALVAVAAGKPVEVTRSRAYGCTVKYR